MNTDERFKLPNFSGDVQLAQFVADQYAMMAHTIDRNTPDGRLKALALTELESSFNWALRAIAEGWLKVEQP